METMVVRNAMAKQLIENKRRLIEVPYTASVNDTLNTLLAHNILAVPVAAPPGQWVGAGGSTILESDKVTGAVRKQYIGMVSMLDILIHIAEYELGTDVESSIMSVPVSAVIGHCLEGLSLWTISPNTSVLEIMEPFSRGIHRALVPLDSHMGHDVGVELTESSPGYRMLTQMDVVRFLNIHNNELKPIIATSVEQLGAMHRSVFAVPANMQVANAVKCMRNASLNAVAIVEDSSDSEQGSMLVIGKGRRLIGTFSATDLRGCPSSMLQSWLSLSVLEFIEKSSQVGKFANCASVALTGISPGSRPLVTCLATSPLEQVISKAVDCHVHRVWVVDQDGLLIGVVALTDILRAIHTMIVRHNKENMGNQP